MGYTLEKVERDNSNKTSNTTPSASQKDYDYGKDHNTGQTSKDTKTGVAVVRNSDGTKTEINFKESYVYVPPYKDENGIERGDRSYRVRTYEDGTEAIQYWDKSSDSTYYYFDDVINLAPENWLTMLSDIPERTKYYELKTSNSTLITKILTDGNKVAITISEDSATGSCIMLNNQLYPLYDVNGDLMKEGQLRVGTTYIFKFSNGKFIFLGQPQVMAVAKEVSKEPTEAEKKADIEKETCENILYVVNPDSPFTVEKIGERREVLSGDMYQKIYSDTLAQERAEYELWKATRLNDVLTLNTLMVPWLAGNEKIRYTSKTSNVTSDYIIKQISGSFSSWTETITASKFYPLYPFVVQ